MQYWKCGARTKILCIANSDGQMNASTNRSTAPTPKQQPKLSRLYIWDVAGHQTCKAALAPGET